MTLTKLLQRQKELSRSAGMRAEALHRLPEDGRPAEEAAVNALYLELFEVERTLRSTPAESLDQVLSKLAIGLRYATDELGAEEDLDANWLMVLAALEDLEVLRDAAPASLAFGDDRSRRIHAAGHIHPGSTSDALVMEMAAAGAGA